MNKFKGFVKRWKLPLIIGGGVVLIVALILGVGTALASRPKTCATCHEIEPAYDQWRISSHYGTSCWKCHTEPGATGYLKMIWRGAGNLIQHAVGDYDYPPQAHVIDGSCLRCHELSARPETIPQDSLRIAHSKHVDQSCDDCHGRLVHTELLNDEPSGDVTAPHTTKTCTVCHKPADCPHGEASVSCASCHQGTVPNHKLSEKRGIMPRESCLECHNKVGVGSEGECRTCHFSPHGVDGLCTRCHTSMDTWTKREFKHPVELLGKHAELTCDRCHNKQGFSGLTYACGNCHRPPHTDYGIACSTCHKQAGVMWKV